MLACCLALIALIAFEMRAPTTLLTPEGPSLGSLCDALLHHPDLPLRSPLQPPSALFSKEEKQGGR
jgi:hypothetical protein